LGSNGPVVVGANVVVVVVDVVGVVEVEDDDVVELVGDGCPWHWITGLFQT
jgi:hypothetical protein